MQSCLDGYENVVSSELLTQEPSSVSLSSDTSQCLSFKECFKCSLPQNFLVNSAHEEADDVAQSDNSHFGDSYSYQKLHLVLNQLLDRHYGHLSEVYIFGNHAADSEGGLMLIHFQELENCTKYDDFESFLSRHFKPQNDFHTYEAQELLKQSQQSCFKMFENLPPESRILEMRSLLWHEFATYFFFLIRSRAHTMQAFEKLEKTIYERFTEYSFFKHACEIPIRGLFKKLHKLKNDYKSCNVDTIAYSKNKHSIYQQQVDLYQLCLSSLTSSRVISHEECSTVEQYLKSSE